MKTKLLVAPFLKHAICFSALMIISASLVFSGCAGGSGDSSASKGADEGNVSYVLQSSAAATTSATIYDFANGYFIVKGSNSKYLLGNSAGYEAQATTAASAIKFYFKPAGLGTYILYDANSKWLNINWFNAVIRNTDRQATIVWKMTSLGNGKFSLYNVSKGKYLGLSGTSLVLKSSVDANCYFSFEATTGSNPFPEASVNMDIIGTDGNPVVPANAMARPAVGSKIVGYADTHAHINHFLGSGQVTFVMEPFHALGILEALNSCAGYHGNGGTLDLWGLAVDGTFGHPTDGYPTFPYWPCSTQTTHQQTYYKWIERSWLAGQRVFVQQGVSNEVLAKFMNTQLPYKGAPTDDMVIADLQIQNILDMQDYVDAQCGGPGKGWFRVCTSSSEARNVISQGKMAVFLSLEYDTVFGAADDYFAQYAAGTITLATLNAKLAAISAQLDKYYAKGVRSVFPVHAFNNGYAGCQLYQGEIFSIINALKTGDYYQPEVSQNPRVFYKQPKADLPADAQGHGNVRGLSATGAWLINQLIAKKFIIEVDHMSDKTMNAALDMIWDAKYPGIIASHTRILDMYAPEDGAWEQMDIPRMIKVMQLGGIISPMLWETLSKHQRCVTDYLRFMIENSQPGQPGVATLSNSEYERYGGPYKVPTSWYNTNTDTSDDLVCGVPYGSDVNGACMLPSFAKYTMYGAINYDDGSFSALYPGVYASTVDTSKVRFYRQTTGTRVFDLETDGRGVSHYGLIPDMIKKLQTQPSRVDMDAMFNSAEAYIRMLERVEKYSSSYPSRDAANWPTTDTEYWHNYK